MADIGPGKLFSCFYDICQEGPQFCHLVDGRCRYCSDYAVDCLTNLQQRNCTRYCMERCIETQSGIHSKTGEYPAAAVVSNAVLGFMVLVCVIYIIDNECLKGSMRQQIRNALQCTRCDSNPSPSNRRIDEAHQFKSASIEVQDVDRQDGEGMEEDGELTQPLNPGRELGNDVLRAGTRSSQNDNQYNPAEGIISVQASVYQNETDVSNISSPGSIGNPTNRDRVGRTGGRHYTGRSRSRQGSEMPGDQRGGENVERRSARGTDRRAETGYNARHIPGSEQPGGYVGGDIVAGELSNTSRSPGPSAMPYHPNQRDTGYGSAPSNSDLSQTCRKVSRNHGQGIHHNGDHNASPNLNHMHSNGHPQKHNGHSYATCSVAMTAGFPRMSNGTIQANHTTATMPRGQSSGTNGKDSKIGHIRSTVESLSLESLKRDSLPSIDTLPEN